MRVYKWGIKMLGKNKLNSNEVVTVLVLDLDNCVKY